MHVRAPESYVRSHRVLCVWRAEFVMVVREYLPSTSKPESSSCGRKSQPECCAMNCPQSTGCPSASGSSQYQNTAALRAQAEQHTTLAYTSTCALTERVTCSPAHARAEGHGWGSSRCGLLRCHGAHVPGPQAEGGEN